MGTATLIFAAADNFYDVSTRPAYISSESEDTELFETVVPLSRPYPTTFHNGSAGNATFVLSTTNNHYWALGLLIIPVLTICGNLLVILSVIRIRSLHSAINCLILALAVADCMIALCVMPFAVYIEVRNFQKQEVRARETCVVKPTALSLKLSKKNKFGSDQATQGLLSLGSPNEASVKISDKSITNSWCKVGRKKKEEGTDGQTRIL